MAPLILDGHTLGEKHRSYNKLVKEGFIIPGGFNTPKDKDDILELLNIDIASKKREVNYIIEVLKSEDELYVSKAIKRSTWLITDPQYAHIINPEYLYSQLRPQMTSRAFNKLILNIRLFLKDQQRVEDFYKYIIKENKASAYKWLQHCSIEFVEREVVKYNRDIPDKLHLRLFRKSFSIFQGYSIQTNEAVTIMSGAEFLARKYPDQFLDCLKTFKNTYNLQFSPKWTEKVSKECLQKILNNFELYGKFIHLATFAKYLGKKENIENFLVKHVNNEKLNWFYSHDNIKHFFHNMPEENRLEFGRKVLNDKELFQDQKKHQTEHARLLSRCAMLCSLKKLSENITTFRWYKYATFETAFIDLKKLIRAESNPATRLAMLKALVASADRNMQHMNTLLQYYHDKHINEPFKFKIQFVNYILSRIDPRSLDDKAWKSLDQLFHSMEHITSEHNVQSCIKFILVRSIIHKEDVPDKVKQKFIFDTLKSIQKKLKTQEDLNAVFDYLYEVVTHKYNNLNITVKQDFLEAISTIQLILNLINDWNRELNDYPDAIDNIKKLIDVNKRNKWNHDLSPLYTIKKSWKRLLFEESLDLLASESVCINALKHDPGLLLRHRERVLAMCSNDAVSLKFFLCKIRLYWSESLAMEWKKTYLEGIEQPHGHKALIGGLCILLPKKELNELIKKHVPTETKISCNDTNQHTISLRKQIAKNAYRARPLVSIDEILPYAKGDYLQFTVPSISSILSQMSANKCRLIIPVLLEAPVSLQKFGIQCAFHKLNSQELKPVLNDIWRSTKSPDIRSILFIYIFAMLCKQNDISIINFIWEILVTFIHQLTADENKVIYQNLGDVYRVPDCIKAQFFMKSYSFLISLPKKCNAGKIVQSMQYVIKDIMDSLDDDFVVNVVIRDIAENIINPQNYIYDKLYVYSLFILTSKDEEMQVRRYQKSLAPTLKSILPLWNKIYDREYRIKRHVNALLEKFCDNMDHHTFEKKKQIPAKTFEMIQSDLENSLSYQNEYVFLTTWKLVTLFVKILNQYSHVITNLKRKNENELTLDERYKMYNETHKLISPPFAKQCIEYIKEDLDRFGPSAYLLFYTALNDFFWKYLSSPMSNGHHRLLYAKYFLEDCDINEVWLVVLLFIQGKRHEYCNKFIKHNFEELRQIVKSRASDDIKIHYDEFFSKVAPISEAE